MPSTTSAVTKVPAKPEHTVPATLLVCMPPLAAELLAPALTALAEAFPAEPVLVATTTQDPLSTNWPSLQLVPYQSTRDDTDWFLTAGDYASASALTSTNPQLQTVLLLGADITGMTPPILHSLANCIRTRNIDLAVPRYTLEPSAGLVNTALLYPLTRALFAADIHFPLPIAAALSPRMIHRLAARHQPVAPQPAALIWPVTEAAIAGLSVREVTAGSVIPPTPREADFNNLFTSVASSLFLDIEAKAPFWQRARTVLASKAPPAAPASPQSAPELSVQIAEMIASFQLAQANLAEIWSLVLPPQTRLALKKLALNNAETFDFAPSLWARVVYDFALAFHLRTINRGHLLGAMLPLYLAWAASHLRSVAGEPLRSSLRIEATAEAFEREKSYLVARWRWPDRFNP